MSSPDLEKLVEEAYSDAEVLSYLRRCHNLQYHRVIERIVRAHFARSSEKQLSLFG